MEQKRQTRIRSKVLIPLAAMFAAMLVVLIVKEAWYYVDLTVVAGIQVCGFFYLYLGRIERSLVKTYQNQQIEIVHRRFAQAQLVEAVENAEAASRAKSEFLSNMSHELRTPMNAIIGFGDLLNEEPLTDEQRDYVNTILSSSQHLLSLINDVLDLTKIESGKMELVSETCSIKELLTKVEAMMRPQAESKGLVFEILCDPAVPDTITGDTRHLYQCLINLAANAIKFTESGSIRIAVELDEDHSGRSIRLAVSDTGIGIPADKQDLVFESFRQADSGTSRNYGGTGLGLSITHKLIEMMGSELTLHSEEGRGSTFTITIPLTCSIPAASS